MFWKKDGNNSDQIALLFEAALRESPQQARKLSRKWHQYRAVSKGFWHQAATISMDDSIRKSEKIAMQDENTLQHFLNYHSQGIVLLTIHMGDYLHSILKILKLSARRKIVILRRKSWSEEEESAFEKLGIIGHDVEIVRHGPTASRSITRALRGGAIAILFYDLPHQWGQTNEVHLFNHQLHWVIGPLQLAMLGKASVIPFFTYNTPEGWICDLKPVRDYSQLGRNCDRAILLHRELQTMANTAESYIKSHVVQWDHWSLLTHMTSGGEHEQSR